MSRSDRAARGAGSGAGVGAGADRLRTHVGFAVCGFSGCGLCDGVGPGWHAADGDSVQLCGDAHLANVAGVASPERQLLFDLDGFDEALTGPWERDVNRLAASVAVAGRENGFKTSRQTAIIRDSVGEYGQAIRHLATMRTLVVWYARASVSDIRSCCARRAR